MKIRIGDYQQLTTICWNRDPEEIIESDEALLLYENNWKYVDSDSLGDDEKLLIDQLINMHGGGVFNV